MSSYESAYGQYLQELLGIPELQESLASVARDVTSIKRQVAVLAQKEGTIMASLDDVIQAQQQEKQSIADATTRVQDAIKNLQDEVAQLQAQGVDTTKVQAILDEVTSETSSIQGIAQSPPPAAGP